ncbi:MAG: DUF2959 domain-containing protein [Planctomycetota bacterium]
MNRLFALLLASSFLLLGSCKSAYYATMEKFGYEKRDLLVGEIEDGRVETAEAQEEFKTTYELFKHVAGYDGGNLEKVYENLQLAYDNCSEAAGDVSSRIADIEGVAGDLFSEWQTEINDITTDSIRNQSEQMLLDTKTRYTDLIGAMKRAEDKMAPVLQVFNDHVLFLKHNLNAQAIASLQDVVLEIEGDVDALIADMEASIQEADAFLQSMGAEGA